LFAIPAGITRSLPIHGAARHTASSVRPFAWASNAMLLVMTSNVSGSVRNSHKTVDLPGGQTRATSSGMTHASRLCMAARR